mmetsp:Transcript_6592/g.17870  ORF Transcript_6592/g.17870 Transcript_6592/m.17870 type:complete len:238 (-) Transcript_6592:59-772(-)
MHGGAVVRVGGRPVAKPRHERPAVGIRTEDVRQAEGRGSEEAIVVPHAGWPRQPGGNCRTLLLCCCGASARVPTRRRSSFRAAFDARRGMEEDGRARDIAVHTPHVRGTHWPAVWMGQGRISPGTRGHEHGAARSRSEAPTSVGKAWRVPGERETDCSHHLQGRPVEERGGKAVARLVGECASTLRGIPAKGGAGESLRRAEDVSIASCLPEFSSCPEPGALRKVGLCGLVLTRGEG